ncbi:hypothetical protein AALA17_00265 [Lactobacillaceae bacterium 24-114]
MTLRELESQIVAARILTVSNKRLIVVTEKGRLLPIFLPRSYHHDQHRLASLRDILRARIWIPVNQQFYHLFKTDWLVEPSTEKS